MAVMTIQLPLGCEEEGEVVRLFGHVCVLSLSKHS